MTERAIETPLDKARLMLAGKTSSSWCICSPCVVSRALADIDAVLGGINPLRAGDFIEASNRIRAILDGTSETPS